LHVFLTFILFCILLFCFGGGGSGTGV
jgi:hypothetical protein